MNWKATPLFITAVIIITSWYLTRPIRAASTTLVVTGYGDFSDLAAGDGVCDTNPNLAGDQCSLRAAIEELNAQGPDASGMPHHIEFNIVVGTGPFTIIPSSPLPSITVPVEIDGATQPEASCPTRDDPANLQIVLDGSSAGTNADGLVLASGSEGSLIRGFAIGNFAGDGIFITSNHNKIRCNHIGLGVDIYTVMENGGSGVWIAGDRNEVGGANRHSSRNVISANLEGMHISGDENEVRNNFVGTTLGGTGDRGNERGIYISGTHNIIGGNGSIERNVISGNGSAAVNVTGEYGIRINGGLSNYIAGNYIGVADDGTTPLPNNTNGIEIVGDASGNYVTEGNIIANNLHAGIKVDESVAGTPTGNLISRNSIYANGTLGIDLGADGVDINDPGDGDSGENERQNYPVLATALGSALISGTLDSHANKTYQIDFYRNNSCDSSGYGEGRVFLNTVQTTTNSAGQSTFQFFAFGSPVGSFITATATDPNGNTSEFSACVKLEAAPTNTPRPTTMLTATSTATYASTATPTSTTTNTPTATPTPPNTETSTPTATYTPTATPTSTSISLPTATHTAPSVGTSTTTATYTPIATNMATNTPTVKSTIPEPSLTPTSSATYHPSPTATGTPSPIAETTTPIPTTTPTVTLSSTPTATSPPETMPTLTSTPDLNSENSMFIFLPFLAKNLTMPEGTGIK